MTRAFQLHNHHAIVVCYCVAISTTKVYNAISASSNRLLYVILLKVRFNNFIAPLTIKTCM